MAGDSPYSESILDEVIDGCLLHLKEHPRNHEILFHLGNAFFLKELYDKASFCFVKAVNLNPKNPSYYMNMGHSYRKLGDREQSIAAYEAALTLNPKFADAHFHIGLIFYEGKLIDKAITSFNNALGVNPRYAAARYHIGRIHQDQGNASRAAAEFRRVIEDNLSSRISEGSVTVNIALVFSDLGLLEQAEREYRSLVRKHPDFADLHFQLGMVLKKRDKSEEAMEEFSLAIKLNPQYMEARRKYWEAAR
ncbi:MAG: tetratricopeptide repeat protein [Candidatus Ozemobacteraceae bacterium]